MNPSELIDEVIAKTPRLAGRYHREASQDLP